MAARKKRKSRKARKKYGCKIVTVCGKRRRLCYGKKGIVSNRPASGGRKSTKKRKSTKRKSTKRRCQHGVVKTGKRKGQCLKNKRAKKR